MTPITTVPAATPAAGRRRVYVLAGTHAQYGQYLREQHLTPREAIFLRRPEQLMGVENPDVRRVGTWYDLPRIAAIEERIQLQTRPAAQEPGS